MPNASNYEIDKRRIKEITLEVSETLDLNVILILFSSNLKPIFNDSFSNVKSPLFKGFSI
jgi:hypothetical protein